MLTGFLWMALRWWVVVAPPKRLRSPPATKKGPIQSAVSGPLRLAAKQKPVPVEKIVQFLPFLKNSGPFLGRSTGRLAGKVPFPSISSWKPGTHFRVSPQRAVQITSDPEGCQAHRGSRLSRKGCHPLVGLTELLNGGMVVWHSKWL